MTKPLHSPDYWHEATLYLSRKDPVLRKLIKLYPDSVLQSYADPFKCMMRALVGQQISVKAADTIWLRFENLIQKKITPTNLQRLSDESLRTIGLSERKVAYAHVLAEFFKGKNTLNYWLNKDDAAVMRELTALHGVGRWTAEMFLFFCLMRPNILPIDDIGLLNAIGKNYYEGQRPTKEQLIAFKDKWSPWNSVATWYLWRSIDPVVVIY
jgi:DNA-3-methyladenine glycosylase II